MTARPANRPAPGNADRIPPARRPSWRRHGWRSGAARTWHRLTSQLAVLPQYLLPHHLLSRAARQAAHCRVRWFREAWIRSLVRIYGIRLDEAAEPDPARYPCFDAFFTRALKAGARPLEGGADCIVSPVDGTVTGIGYLERGMLPQAKGQRYELRELFAGCPGDPAERFRGGAYASLYLAPRDYHRVHVPIDATPTAAFHVPGRLYSVGRRSRSAIPRLYARNERLLLLFATAAGPMAIALIGAMLVGGLESVCTGRICGRTARSLPLSEAAGLARGAELGRFHFGSSVLLLFASGPNRVRWTLDGPGPVRMGQALAHVAAAAWPGTDRTGTASG